MPPRDLYHHTVIQALVKDGWKITHDPLRLIWASRFLYVDLAATQFIAAEQATQRIAVEIKNFRGIHDIAELEKALGQYMLYHTIMQITEPTLTLYLALPRRAYSEFFAMDVIGRQLAMNCNLRFLVYDVTKKEVVQWIR